jgi:hypothetical protein
MRQRGIKKELEKKEEKTTKNGSKKDNPDAFRRLTVTKVPVGATN